MILTGLEILHLARYAGLEIALIQPGDELDEQMESEYRLHQLKDGKLFTISDDNGIQENYKTLVTCDGCDHNEAMPLGNKCGGV